ncbi:hypothetical protein [aff. Roholtiella sp. LEGE 12411]|uniref:hypothetical protein n=1 Tax=aff. Roholtiella sp. LEGE 12411 TaxID=1828822 RepID=UPI001FC7E88C|nr:hypothetical protein [aff. Roholtiella sp. LEGE 12411]
MPKDNGYQKWCGDPGGIKGQGTRIAKATGCKLVQGVSANTIVETIAAELAAQITVIGNVSLVARGATASFVQAIAPTVGHGPLSRNQDHQISFDVSWIGKVAATSEVQVFNGSLDVVVDGEVIGGKTVKITVPSSVPELPPIEPNEDIPMTRPENVSGTWMLIHQVTGTYFQAIGYNPDVNDYIHTWSLDPPNTNAGYQGHLWNLVKQTDGTYLIQSFEKDFTYKEQLYLQAPAKPGDDGYPRLQRKSASDLQTWVLVPVSGDPDTYAIQPKSFPEYALGLVGHNCQNSIGVVAHRTWGKPTFHHYWRLSKDYTGGN